MSAFISPRRKYKLLLINPLEKKTGLGAYKGTTIPPLALSYIAALTPDNYDIRIIDENIEPLTFPEADIVGITSYTAHINRAYQVARHYRQRSVPVVMGGIHASMLPEEALSHCSCVVCGEAEPVWATVISDFENGGMNKIYGPEIADMASLPPPRRDLLRRDRYRWDAILTSRGCPMDCNFCSVTRFNGRKFRRRPLERVINELKSINRRYVIILDDNILGHNDTEWLYRFFQAIIDNGIKKYFFAQTSLSFGKDKKLIRLAKRAGLRVVLIGIESVESPSLEGYNKRLNRRYLDNQGYVEAIRNIRLGGIAVFGCFILGSDGDTIESFDKTLDFIKKANIDILQITKPTPLPGTKFFEALKRSNRILNRNYPDAWKDYRFTSMLYKPKHLSVSDVYEGHYYIRHRFYSRPEKIRRCLNALLTTKSLSALIAAHRFNGTYEKSFRSAPAYAGFDTSKINRKFRKR